MGPTKGPTVAADDGKFCPLSDGAWKTDYLLLIVFPV